MAKVQHDGRPGDPQGNWMHFNSRSLAKIRHEVACLDRDREHDPSALMTAMGALHQPRAHMIAPLAAVRVLERAVDVLVELNSRSATGGKVLRSVGGWYRRIALLSDFQGDFEYTISLLEKALLECLGSRREPGIRHRIAHIQREIAGGEN
ncbi:MAG: hypothetical protein DRJ42_25655 [Deltaproteobacteria bacterium]|nr:MAG: hypothetical protein DRJ42_25655 [Deltaproteobacteria bacterium]